MSENLRSKLTISVLRLGHTTVRGERSAPSWLGLVVARAVKGPEAGVPTRDVTGLASGAKWRVGQAQRVHQFSASTFFQVEPDENLFRYWTRKNKYFAKFYY